MSLIFNNFAGEKHILIMKGYREKVKPTREGLEELDESTRNATIERLIAGIQCKRTSPEQLMELTEHLRKRHSIEDKELYRLGDFSKDYNQLYATRNNRCFGTEGIALSKRQSQYKSWRKVLKTTSPRYKPTPRDAEEPQSIYQASFLTYRPFERDMWGPASYGRLVEDLWTEVDTLVNNLEDGKRLCKDMIAEEDAIDKDPERKEELFWKQYRAEAERNKDTIALHVEKGIVDTNHPVYKKMLTYPDTITGYARNHFHDPSETQFSGFVVVNETLILQNNDITYQESKLLGKDLDKIKMLRFAVDHLEELLPLKGQRFEKVDTMCLIKWCNVVKSIKRKDNERELFNYIRGRYKGQYRFYGWSCLFALRKQTDDSEDEWKKPVAAFNKKLMDLYIAYNGEQKEPEK